MSSLFGPISMEPHVGPRRAEILAKLPIRTPGEMLFFFPRNYEDFSNFTDIRHLQEDELQTVCARILKIYGRPTRRGWLTTIEIEDGTYGLAELVFFNQKFRERSVQTGQICLISGKPKQVKRKWQFPHPMIRALTTEEIVQINENSVPGNRLGTRKVSANAQSDAPPTKVPEDFSAEEIPTADQFLGLQPVYRLTEGVQQWEMRRLARGIIQKYANELEDAFPAKFRETYFLLPIREAIQGIHFPKTQEILDRARRRFVFQELFLLQLALEVRRRQQQSDFRAPILEVSPEIDRRIRQLFPFDLTQGQLKAIADVTRDTVSGRPMNRLIQGDVGCGKTSVAIYALLLAVAHGYQAAIMAPTEVLARQHARTLRKLLIHSPIEIVELVGGQRPQERRLNLEKIATGTAKIVVGTQALLQKDVVFSNLAMAVIDEQHKFGVNQRAALRRSGQSPHYLVMTATPIPRSVTMTLFGDLDLTIIRDLPPGRQKIKTYLASRENRDGWWTFFCEKLRSGAQGYVVVPRIGDTQTLNGINENQTQISFESVSENPSPKTVSSTSAAISPPFVSGGESAVSSLGSKSVPTSASRFSSNSGSNSSSNLGPSSSFGTGSASARPVSDLAFEQNSEQEHESDVANLQALYRELSDGPLAEFSIGILHGRMTQEEKESVMFKFRTGELKVLISTQVIEVGVDIPNATLMTIDSAERFGLAQLHQLRGRIARGTKPGYCCVFASNDKEETLERLRHFTSTTDGFVLSETDFKLRGPGNLFGTQQHGLPPFLIADLLRDAEILEETRTAARETLKSDPGLADPEFRRIRQQMLKRYGTVLELGDVG